jgi:lipopolysaccharide/colanic/teichoic acid biosynthesis glycosyltransferase
MSVPRENLLERARKRAPRTIVPSSVSARAIDELAVSPHSDLGATAAPKRADWLLDASCRALDIVGSAILLIVLAPLLAVIAVAIRLDSPGPAFFRQRRLGRDLKPFTVLKFRTMSDGVSDDHHREFVTGLINGLAPALDELEAPGPRYKLTKDPRVTRCGGLLRRSSLDELPQLWNVLRGEMSLVGPRPPIPYEVEQYPPHWLARFEVKPGVTGLWQVSGRSNVTLEEMVALDVDYIRRRSVWLNIVLLLRTVPAVLSTAGAW